MVKFSVFYVKRDLVELIVGLMLLMVKNTKSKSLVQLR